MPAAVTAIVSAIGTAVGGTAGAFLIMNATAIATVTLTAGSIALGAHQRRKAAAKARAAYNASLEDRLVSVSVNNAARSRCYGRVRNSDGVLFKATRGANKEFYTLVIGLAGHEIDGVETIYFGDKPVTLDANGYVLDEPYNLTTKTSKSQSITLNGSGGGSVTAVGTIAAGSAAAAQVATASTDNLALTVSVAGQVITVSGGTAGATATVSWQESASASNARVRIFNGSPTQDLSSVLQPLFPTLITSGQHRFAGIACLLVDLEYNTDSWPSGVPQITAVFRGAKVFDPRTSTTAWTENPALIARDWALYSRGGGCTTSDLVEASFTAAANACDTSTTFPLTTGNVTLPLYTCGIVCPLDQNPWETFQEITESMAGKAGWAGGQLRVVAGVYRAPVATLTEDWVSGEAAVQVIPEPPTDEAVNTYRAQIADKAQGFIPVQAPELRAGTYIVADGRELVREVTFGAVTDTTHAQHVAGVLMRDARNALTVVITCNLRAFQLELFDVLSVTLPRFGWTAKTFEVVGWRFALTGGVELTLKETAAAIFQPDSSFAVLDVTPNTELPNPTSVVTVTGLQATTQVEFLNDGQPVVRMLTSWNAHPDAGVQRSGFIELSYLYLGTTDQPIGWVNTTPSAVTWSNSSGQAVTWNSEQPTDASSPTAWFMERVRGSQTSAVINGLRANAIYLLRARAENGIGVRSDWCIQKVVITGGISLPGAVETWEAFDASGVGKSTFV